MTDQVLAYIQKHHMTEPGDHICVAVSGGADSVCLLLVLDALQERAGVTLSVIHVEHGIRGGESMHDMAFTEKLAEQLGIPCTCVRADVPSLAVQYGRSLEETGRIVRYRAFAEEKRRIERERAVPVKIALAHHMDDNAETVLFHMCRGSGIEGLAGIRPVYEDRIRPLLCVTRAEIEDWLQKNGQPYCVDATNTDVAYSRNRIRQNVMPQLSAVNTAAAEHICLLAEDAAELADYAHAQVRDMQKQMQTEQSRNRISVRTEPLSGYPAVLQRLFLRELYAQLAGSRKDISRRHVAELLDLADGATGRKADLAYGIRAEKVYDRLILSRQNLPQGGKAAEQEQPAEYFLYPGGNGAFEAGKTDCQNVSGYGITLSCHIFPAEKKHGEIPKNRYTKWFDYDKIKDGLCLRSRHPGDYLSIDPDAHRQKLKDYWINRKVPQTARRDWPLLADGSHILWIIGDRISAGYKVTDQTTQILEAEVTVWDTTDCADAERNVFRKGSISEMPGIHKE